MEEHKKEVETFEQKEAENSRKLSEARKKFSEAQSNSASNLAELEKAVKDLEKERESIKKLADELKNKERKMPWNVDTISKPGFAKTVINTKPPRPKDENLTEEEKEERMRKFIKEHGKESKHYGLLRRYEDSRAYLKAHDALVCEDTANHLVIWCINLEMEQVMFTLIVYKFYDYCNNQIRL